MAGFNALIGIEQQQGAFPRMSNDAELKRLLILDDDADFRKLVMIYLKKMFTGLTLVEYDPVVQGAPGEGFDWAEYDVLLLDYYLSIEGVTGLDILQANRKNKRFPATIMLTGAGNEEVAVRAVKAGVYEYLRKAKLDKQQLHTVILEAFEKYQAEQSLSGEMASQSRAFDKAAFYQQLERHGDELGKRRILLLVELDNHEILEERLGVILRDNIIKYIAREGFEFFKAAALQPSVTLFSDICVALLIDDPVSEQTLNARLTALCQHLEKRPYRLDDQSFGFTVSIGVLALAVAQGSAEQIIVQVRQACEIANGEEGNSFYIAKARLYKLSAIEAAAAKPAALPPKPQAAPSPPETQPPEATPQLKLVVPEGKSAVARAEPPSSPAAAPPGVAAQKRPAKAAPAAAQKAVAAARPAPTAQAQTKPQAKPQAKTDNAAQKIKQAFDEKRVIQTFRPIIPLANSGADEAHTIYGLSLQVLGTDGKVIEAAQIYAQTKAAAFRKYIDRWMIRETVGRVLNAQAPHTFVLSLSQDSLTDAGFFGWLRKLLAGLDKKDPSRSIALEIRAADFSAKAKQANALIGYLTKHHDFRFILSEFPRYTHINPLISKAKFSLARIDQEQIRQLARAREEGGGSSLLDDLQVAGVKIIADKVEDAGTLTEMIAAGADYAQGNFIGEPTQQLDEASNMESLIV